MSDDTVRPPHIAYKLFLMATSELGRHVVSQLYISTGHKLCAILATSELGRHVGNQLYISTGHKLCAIFMKLGVYDLHTKLNKCVKQLSEIQNRLAVTANQT